MTTKVPNSMLLGFVTATAASFPTLAFSGNFGTDENNTVWNWIDTGYFKAGTGSGGSSVGFDLDGGTATSTDTSGDLDGGTATSSP